MTFVMMARKTLSWDSTGKLDTRGMDIKLILVEDHEIVRKGILALLEGESDIRVIAEAANGDEALSLIRAKDPDFILMDLNMPVMNGVEATRHIRRDFPNKKILILSMHDHEEYLFDILDAGADGYILKNSSRAELLFAIRKIAENGKYISTEFVFNLLEKYKSNTVNFKSAKTSDLKVSDREMDVLQLVAKGQTNMEIAAVLFTSVRTIETRRKNLLDKTGTTNTATLIKFAVQHGLVR